MPTGRAMYVLVVALTVMAAARAQKSSRMSQEELNRMESYTHVPADVKAFAAEYVAAWNARDSARLARLTVSGRWPA